MRTVRHDDAKSADTQIGGLQACLGYLARIDVNTVDDLAP